MGWEQKKKNKKKGNPTVMAPTCFQSAGWLNAQWLKFWVWFHFQHSKECNLSHFTEAHSNIAHHQTCALILASKFFFFGIHPAVFCSAACGQNMAPTHQNCQLPSNKSCLYCNAKLPPPTPTPSPAHSTHQTHDKTGICIACDGCHEWLDRPTTVLTKFVK